MEKKVIQVSNFHILCKRTSAFVMAMWVAKDGFIFSAFSRLMRNYNNDNGSWQNEERTISILKISILLTKWQELTGML